MEPTAVSVIPLPLHRLGQNNSHWAMSRMNPSNYYRTVKMPLRLKILLFKVATIAGNITESHWDGCRATLNLVETKLLTGLPEQTTNDHWQDNNQRVRILRVATKFCLPRHPSYWNKLNGMRHCKILDTYPYHDRLPKAVFMSRLNKLCPV